MIRGNLSSILIITTNDRNNFTHTTLTLHCLGTFTDELVPVFLFLEESETFSQSSSTFVNSSSSFDSTSSAFYALCETCARKTLLSLIVSCSSNTLLSESETFWPRFMADILKNIENSRLKFRDNKTPKCDKFLGTLRSKSCDHSFVYVMKTRLETCHQGNQPRFQVLLVVQTKRQGPLGKMLPGKLSCELSKVDRTERRSELSEYLRISAFSRSTFVDLRKTKHAWS